MFGRKKDDETGRTIASFDLGAGPTWAALSLADPDRPGGQQLLRPFDEVAAELTTDAAAAGRLTSELEAAFPGLVEAQPHAQLLGVWVPDPVAGATQAVLVLELLVGEGATLDDLEASLSARTAVPGREVLSMTTVRTDLPAGPALVADVTSGEPGAPVEFQRTVWVAPTDCDDMVSLSFSTTALHLVDDVQEEAVLVADSLTLELAPAVAR